MNTLRELDSAERDAKNKTRLYLMFTKTSFNKIERHIKKENESTIEDYKPFMKSSSIFSSWWKRTISQCIPIYLFASSRETLKR